MPESAWQLQATSQQRAAPKSTPAGKRSQTGAAMATASDIKPTVLQRTVPQPAPTEESTELAAEAATAREEERESLEAIYGSEFEVLGLAEWLVRIGEGAALRMYLPAAYPTVEPPTLVIELESCVAPPGLVEQLLEQWVPGEVCVYQWVEILRAELENVLEALPASLELEGCESDEALAQFLVAEDAQCDMLDAEIGDACDFLPATSQYGQRRRVFGNESADAQHSVEILHGEPVVDRKSVFQAHLARVSCIEQVNCVHRQLLSDKKIAAATHNIVAYRFRDEVRGVLVSDNDDDGETSAGGRLAELLSLRGVEGVFVMVTRWYGGIQLGPERFKDINRAAQLLLDSAGFSKHGGMTLAKASRKGR